MARSRKSTTDRTVKNTKANTQTYPTYTSYYVLLFIFSSRLRPLLNSAKCKFFFTCAIIIIVSTFEMQNTVRIIQFNETCVFCAAQTRTWLNYFFSRSQTDMQIYKTFLSLDKTNTKFVYILIVFSNKWMEM